MNTESTQPDETSPIEDCHAIAAFLENRAQTYRENIGIDAESTKVLTEMAAGHDKMAGQLDAVADYVFFLEAMVGAALRNAHIRADRPRSRIEWAAELFGLNLAEPADERMIRSALISALPTAEDVHLQPASPDDLVDAGTPADARMVDYFDAEDEAVAQPAPTVVQFPLSRTRN